MADKHPDCAWILERIEAAVDDELATGERAAFREHVGRCPACAKELALAARVRDEVRALPRREAPDRVVGAAARAAGVGAAPAANVIPLRVPRARRLRWIPAAAAALVLVASGIWFDHRRTPGNREEELARAGVSDAELAAASAEVALAFGYVEKYSARAAVIVRDDVLGERVAPRVERAIGESRDAANDALIPGLRRAVRESGLDVTSPPPGRS